MTRILHFDDTSPNAALLHDSLKADNVDSTIIQVGSIAEFETALTKERFDIIISEHQPPIFDGELALQKAKLLSPKTPFIFFCSNANTSVAKYLIDKGADDYIFKAHASRLAISVAAAIAKAFPDEPQTLPDFGTHPFLLVPESDFQVFIFVDKDMHVRAFNNAAKQWADQLFDCALAEGVSAQHCFSEHPDFQQYFKSALSGKPMLVEKSMVGKNNATYWYGLNYSPFTTEAKHVSGVYICAINITEQKIAEEAIRLAEEKNKALFDNSIIGIYQSTLDGVLLNTNPKLAQILGYDSPRDLLSSSINLQSIYINPSRRAEFITELKENGSVSEFISQIYRKDGSVIWISEYAKMMEGRQTGFAPLIEGTLIDITDKKKTEEELLKSQALIISIYNNADVGICLTNEEAMLEEVNPAFCKLFGYGKDELIGKNASLLIATEHRRKFTEGYKKHFDRQTPYSTRELKGIRKDGKEVDVYSTIGYLTRENGKRCMVSTTTDITERKRAEEALRRTEERLRTVITNIPIVLTATDKDGIYTLVEGRGLREAGINPNQLLGKSAFLVFGDQSKFFNGLRRVLNGETVNGTLEFYGRYFDTSATPLYDDHNQIIGSISVSIDVTERKIAEQEKERLQNQLLQSQKMEALGNLTGGIAHDFNNLLAGIIGSLGLLKRHVHQEPKPFRQVLRVEAAAQRAASLTKKLLAFSRQSELQTKPLQVNDCIRSVIEILEHTIDKRIAVTCDLQPNLPFILGDENQLEQVFLNLAVNACDSMITTVEKTGFGRCNFSSKIINPNARIIDLYRLDPSKPYILIEVEDTGEGIPEELRGKVFEPFFTTKGVGKGTGLGLSIVYGIVTKHKGAIGFDSKPNQGTTFSIYLPLPLENEEISNYEVTMQGKKNSSSILVIDDEEILRDLLDDMLTEQGYHPLLANDGKIGVDLYQKNHDRIDAVILDMNLEEMHGRETYLKLSEINPDVKVL
ncbi:MAG: PAS domain S-box protein, partial [Chlorobiales bacterium]|nr:PAS domain S-box protein [Chlorobiales bacterium]